MNEIKKDLLQGAIVNAFGIVGKIAGPSLLIVLNQLYGTELFGIFITANMLIEISLSFLTNGFKDGTLIQVSKYSDEKSLSSLLYQALSNAFAWSIVFCSLLFVFFLFWGDVLLTRFYSPEFSENLIPMMYLMGIALPLMAFERVVVAGSQGLKIMKYEAIINGWLRPILLLLCSILFYFVDESALGIAYSYVTTQLIVFSYSVYLLLHLFDLKKLVESFKQFTLNRELLSYAIPQNINTTLTRFLTGIDVLMLPLFGATPLQVGIYGTGSTIIREIRHIKLAFSAPFNPLIVKLFRDKDLDGLRKAYAITSNYIFTFLVPILLLLSIFYGHVLELISTETINDASFMLYLLPVPYFFCSFSLAGNVISMTGHSKVVLFNSFVVTVLNVLFNILLIPQFGLIGAAIGSSLSMFFISGLEQVQAWRITGVNFITTQMLLKHFWGLLIVLLVQVALQKLIAAPTLSMLVILCLLGCILWLIVQFHEEVLAGIKKRF